MRHHNPRSTSILNRRNHTKRIYAKLSNRHGRSRNAIALCIWGDRVKNVTIIYGNLTNALRSLNIGRLRWMSENGQLGEIRWRGVISMALVDRIEQLKKAIDVGKKAKLKKVAASVKRKLARIEVKKQDVEKKLSDGATGKERKKLERQLKYRKAQIAKGQKALAAMK